MKGKRIWVAGHNGMVGAAVKRRLQPEDCEILTVARNELDLRAQVDTERWVLQHKPDVVVIAAAKVGGIMANATFPAEFLYDNLMIEANIIHAAYKAGVKKLLFLGSSCIYPKFAEQPISENALLTGMLEPTNEAYAVAKIAGIKLCEAYRKQYGCDFISAMPCNLYGPGDNFNLETSHVIPALMKKAGEAKEEKMPSMTVWGSGRPLREFLYVDDLADALVFLLKNYSGGKHVNVGSGEDIAIGEVAKLVIDVVGFKGALAFDRSKPDGTPRKLMDSSRIFEAGRKPATDLRTGLKSTWEWYRGQEKSRKAA
ncbi:MAG: GDP-L-fucose synthase [Alphaproteobacteria bacterium]|nr:GDP-L-fucose synthase [Alphaproteobacteria bacterium]